MKKIWLTVFLILILTASIASGDEVGQTLSGMASEEVMSSTRQLIQSGIKSHSAIEVTRAMAQNRFKTQHIINAHQVILNAHQQGLPPNLVINKVFEGISKHIQADRIISAMTKVKARYAFAYKQAVKLTNEKTHMNKVGYIIASGLAAGLNEKGIETITHSLQERSQGLNDDQRDALVLETFKTARDMARLGVTSSQTAALVSQALQHQFSAHQMQNMRAAFMQDSRATAPQSLAVSYGQAIQQGKSFEGSGGKSGGGGPAGSGGGAGSSGGGSG
ncbi:MAG: hypothetical protein KAR15_11745, partial [Desulfobacterales bacterium]|nr:hypothetical protein [Desulfobacterales bacterium]